MKKTPCRATSAYTIIEVMVAAGILVIGVAAAAALALTMVSQEESNAQVARAFNIQEQAGRLYQLGLAPAEIASILPPEPNVEELNFTTGATNVTGVGDIETAEIEMLFNSGEPMASGDSTSSRTNTILLVRPSIR